MQWLRASELSRRRARDLACSVLWFFVVGLVEQIIVGEPTEFAQICSGNLCSGERRRVRTAGADDSAVAVAVVRLWWSRETCCGGKTGGPV
jgi:hypothetical protein